MAGFVSRIFLFAGIAAFAASAGAAERVALVIGNGAYAPHIALDNPPNDAKAVAEKLEGLGFRVLRVVDGDLATMSRALDEFAGEAKGAEAALVYYSGHGAQVEGGNYLIPVDFSISANADLATEALPMDVVLKRLGETEARAKLVFFDACRDNPLKTKGLTRKQDGLGRVEARSPNTFIGFATTPGEVALDGGGTLSPFTGALLDHIATPGSELSDVMRRTRADVMAATGNQQTPWDESSLTEAFFFAPEGDAPEPVREEAAVIVVAPPPPPLPERGGDFVFADSSTRPLDASDLAGLGPAMLRLARNEIFARAGRRFNDPGLDRHFRRFDWYQPVTWDPDLSAVERRNVELIRRYELGYGAPAEAAPEPAPSSAHGFLFPDSDRRRLTDADIAGLSKDELRIARNEIFARRGRFFKSADLKAYFSQFPWYRPHTAEPLLSAVEKANVSLLEKAEKRR